MLRERRLVDVSVVLDEYEYPKVCGTWSREGYLPWGSEDAPKPRELTDVKPPELLLARDVLDGMVLDLQNRRATRANDLLLMQSDGELRLVAADVSVWAAIRRLTRGLLWRRASTVYDWKYVEFLRGDPAGVAHGSLYHGRVARLPAGDIAVLCRSVPYLHAAELITLLPDPLAAETLQALPAVLQRQVIGELDPDYATGLLELMASDLAADLLGRLGRDRSEEFLNRMKAPEKVLDLLHYPPDTVGGIMTNDLLVFPAETTVDEARRVVRKSGTRFVYSAYVMAGDRLTGIISLLDLVVAPPEKTVGDMMNPFIASLGCTEPAKAAAYRVLQSGLPAWPVLDQEGRLLGSVTEDIALDFVVPAALSEQLPRVLS